MTKNENQAAYFKGISFKEEITSLESKDIPNLNSQNLTSSGFILKSSGNFDVRNLINNQPYKLSDLIKITQGITTGGNEYFLNTKSHFLNKGISEDVLKKVLKGKTINRYRVLYNNDYILYSTKSTDKDIQNKVEVLLDSFKEKLSKKRETKQGKLPWYCLHWARGEKDFNEQKILIRQTASHIIGVLDTQNHYPIDTIHTLNLKSEVKDKEKVLKFLLGLLNSKLFKYLYSWKLDEGGKVYPQVKKVNIEWLPIPEYNDSESISSEVDKLQKIISKEEQIRVNFLKYLESKFKSVSKYSGIQNWHELEFGEFINGLNKAIKKASEEKLNKIDEMEWMEVFETKKTEAQTLKAEIDRVDKEIDQMVYELYGLSGVEIKIVEEVN